MDDLFERLFEGHPDAWSVVEIDGERIVIVRVNPAQAARFGMTCEEFQSADLRALASPEHYARWLSMMQRATQASAACSFDFESPPLVGGFARATIVPLGPAANGLLRFGVQIRDETARQAAEQALSRSEARLAQAQEIGQVGDWELDLATGAGTWSRQMFRITGWPGDEPPSFEEFQRLVVPADRKRIVQFHHDLVASEQSNSTVFRLLTPSGEARRIAVTAVCVRDAAGVPLRICGVNHDISQIEAALESAQRHAAELELLFEDNVNGVFFSLLDEPIEWNDGVDKESLVEWVLDHARPVRVNRALCAITGLPEHGLIGRALRGFFPDPRAARQMFRTLYDSGRVHLSRVARLRADGSPFLSDLDLVAMRDERQRITGQFGVMRDVTEQRALEERLLVAERMASLGTLAAGVGHEINNPLTYVSANLALIDEALASRAARGSEQLRTDDELRGMLADARDGVQRIVHVVRNLRSLTRSEALARRRVALAPVLERSLALAEHEIRHRARVVRNFEGAPAVFADEGRLVQLFLNLLVNAAQAISEGASESNFIRVSAGPTGPEEVVIEVEDSGVGMSPEILGRIFDPFFTTKNVGEGTGLGLPICHSIVNELGGSIEVESADGVGSTFRVRLAVAGAEVADPAPAPDGVDPGPRRLRILVIDDEPTVGQLLARILRGSDVVVETRARDALERLRAGERFDRIVCDVMMPEMSGMDFYHALFALDHELARSMLFMTGGAFSARAAAFLESVPNVTLEKPFEPSLLRAAVFKEPR